MSGQTTGTTAAKLMAECGRDNITVRYGPQIGDATRLEGLEDNSFDIVWSSLMLGAFGEAGSTSSAPVRERKEGQRETEREKRD